MSELESDRKRRASEMDPAVVVVPKKKFLAAQAEAAASDIGVSKGPSSPVCAAVEIKSAPFPTTTAPTPAARSVSTPVSTAASSSASAPVPISAPPSASATVHATSYSVRDNAPAGARGADDEEHVRFQNSQLFAANQAHRNEICRLSKQIETLQSQLQKNGDFVACVQKHWLLLADELKHTFDRLESRNNSTDHSLINDAMRSLLFFQFGGSDLDLKLSSTCDATQVLMQEVVQALMDRDAREKSRLQALEGSSKADVEHLIKMNSELESSLKIVKDELRIKTLQEISQAAELARISTLNASLNEELSELKHHLEMTERRLVRSEESFRKLSSAGGVSRCIASASSDAGAELPERESSDGLDLRAADYKCLAESRLEEIREKNKKILQLETQSLAGTEMSEPSEQLVVQSAIYQNLSEQLNRSRKDCEYHAHKLQLVSAELSEVKERMIEERQRIEMLHNVHMSEQLSKLSHLGNQLLDAKQEIRSLQFKLEQKSASEVQSKRSEELSENLMRLQEEYKRLKAECDLLKQRPDADELRREFREREEKIAKERDLKQLEANDYLDQIRNQERKIAMLMGRNGEGAAHGGANGVETTAQREVEALKKEMEGLRNERKDFQRRFMKADRGFNDCNKLYQQVKKEKEALMKDVESLGLSFEDMQEQNVRLLQQLKTKDEEQNELLKQRMRDKTQRESMNLEMMALKSKLEKCEELLRVKEDCVEKYKVDMEQQRQEFLKRKKEEECDVAAIAAHRISLQKKEQAAMEAKREADKMRSELNEQQRRKRENMQSLQDVEFEKNRLAEEIATLKTRLQAQVSERKTSTASADHLQLIDHYRSRVKCHCRQDDKARVLPCGHAMCIKCCRFICDFLAFERIEKECCDNLIKERSRKCPACSKKFDQSEIRPLFLQGSSDEG